MQDTLLMLSSIYVVTSALLWKHGFCSYQVTENLLNLLDIMKKWISEIPPISQPQRFGNKAYRTWFQRVHEVSLFLDIY